MSSDPVDRATDESPGLYEITTWEPRSWLDRVARRVYWVVRYAVRWLPILVSALLLYYQFQGSAVIDSTVRLLIVLSILPAFGLAAFVWFSDVTRNEPLGLLLATFLLAVVLGPFAGVLNLLVPFAVLLLLGAILGAFGITIDALAVLGGGPVAAPGGGLLPLPGAGHVAALGATLSTHLAGVQAAVPAAIGGPLAQFGGGLLPNVVLGLYFYLVVGPVEESIKLLAVRLYAFRSADFDAVIDGAVYGAVAGLGFATVENALYITRAIEEGLGTGTFGGLPFVPAIAAVRALAGPGHVIYSAIAGYYLGLAKFNSENAGPIVVKGLLVATVFHGTYNLLVGIVPGALASFSPALGPDLATVVFIVGYDGLIGYYLYRKIGRYRRVYHTVAADDDGGATLTVDRTEFDPGGGRRPPGGR